MLRLILMLPFFVPAEVLAIIAGLIGGRQWHVKMVLEQHVKGTPLVSMTKTDVIVE